MRTAALRICAALSSRLVSGRSAAGSCRGSVRALAAIALALGLAIALGMIWPRSWASPLGAALLAATALVFLARELVIPLRRAPSVARYTRAIDEQFAALGERHEFLSALELGGAPARAGVSPDLVAALIAERAAAAGRLDLEAPGRRAIGRPWLGVGGCALLLLLAMGLAAPGRFTQSLAALVSPAHPAPRRRGHPSADRQPAGPAGKQRHRQGADHRRQGRPRSGAARAARGGRVADGGCRLRRGDRCDGVRLHASQHRGRHALSGGGGQRPIARVPDRRHRTAARGELPGRVSLSGLCPFESGDGAIHRWRGRGPEGHRGDGALRDHRAGGARHARGLRG